MSAKKNLDAHEYDMYFNCIKDKIAIMIEHDLTVGRQNNHLREFNHAEVNKYMQNNKICINLAIKEMIQDYYEDNDLESLKDPEFIWIAEYLYDFIDFADISDDYYENRYGDDYSDSDLELYRKRKQE